MQVNNIDKNSVSFKGVIFKNKAIYAKYSNGLVGSIRNNSVVDSFKNRTDIDMIFSATQGNNSASFYWQLKKKNGLMGCLKNMLAPKVYFEGSRFASKPNADAITLDEVNTYISKHLD